MLRGVQERLSEEFNVQVRSYSGAYVTDFINLFTTEFEENDWCNVSGVFLLIGTNHIVNTQEDIFAKKYNALLQIIRARLGNIFFVVCTFNIYVCESNSINHRLKGTS